MNNYKILNIKNKTQRKQGFSLIEVLIALMVLSIGMVSVAVLLTNSIKVSINNKNQVIASQLAQEGIELVHNIRDNNPAKFISTGNQCFSSDNTYVLEKDISSFLPCSVSAAPKAENTITAFYVDDGTGPFAACPKIAGFYASSNVCGVTARSKTKFYRKTWIDNDGGNKQVLVKVSVTWNGTGFPVAPCNVANKCISVDSVLPDLQ